MLTSDRWLRRPCVRNRMSVLIENLHPTFRQRQVNISLPRYNHICPVARPGIIPNRGTVPDQAKGLFQAGLEKR